MTPALSARAAAAARWCAARWARIAAAVARCSGVLADWPREARPSGGVWGACASPSHRPHTTVRRERTSSKVCSRVMRRPVLRLTPHKATPAAVARCNRSSTSTHRMPIHPVCPSGRTGTRLAVRAAGRDSTPG